MNDTLNTHRPDTGKVYSAEKNKRFDNFIMLVGVQ